MGRFNFAVACALCAVLSLAGCGGSAVIEPDEETVESVDSAAEDVAAGKEDMPEVTIDSDAAEDEVRVVGSDEYGYVSVPASWVEFRDVEANSSIQWCDGSEATIISLNRFNLESVPEEQREAFGLEDAGSSVWENMIYGGADEESITGAHVTLGGHEAVQVYGAWTDGSFLVTWLVDDGEGGIRYVAAEGTEETIMDAVAIVEDTWTL